MRGRRQVALVLVAAVAVFTAIAVAALYASPELGWRARLAKAKLSGDLPQVPVIDFVRWLRPGSPVYLGNLVETMNVQAGITNEDTSVVSARSGSELYAKHCASCHGDNAQGAAGTNLMASMESGLSDWEFLAAVKWGRPGTSMAAQPLSDPEIWNVHTFLRQEALKRDGVKSAEQRDSLPVVNVPYDAIVSADSRPDDWVTYAGNYAGHRHSPLSKINRHNVARLQLAWTAQLRGGDSNLQATPIVAGGRIFVTESPDGVVALEAASGRLLWRYRRPVPSDLSLCCGSPNRGVAILGDRIFVGTIDAQLVALDAGTGKLKWDVQVADPKLGYTMTGAPLAIRDAIVVGVAGGEFGVRGFIAAFSASDGRVLWKFDTVPGPGEPGHETWGGDSWKTGGGPTWTVGAFDPALGLVYWGIGNPSPNFNGDLRPGDNLYTNSVVALDAATGKLRWYYQFTPADEHDWDAVQQPVLADLTWNGRPRRLLLWANRNAFFYVLDRETGEFLLATPYSKQTWASGFDAKGRPMVRPESRPSATGSLVWPWVGGASNWMPPAFDRSRNLLYVPTIEAASIYFRANAVFATGKEFYGGSSRQAHNQPVTASIKAIDAQTGNIAWESQLARGGKETIRNVGGLMSTAGGLVFGGLVHEFLAYDADSGRILWRIRLGGHISAAPIAYSANGREFIAVMSGKSLFVFTLPEP